MRRPGALVTVFVAGVLVVAVGGGASAQGFALGAQGSYLFGGSGMLMYGVTGELPVSGPLSVRASLLIGSISDPYTGLSFGTRWVSALGLFHMDGAAARPYLGAGVGEFSVGFAGVSLGVTALDFVGGMRLALNETAAVFAEGHYLQLVGVQGGYPGSGGFALSGGLLYSF